MPVKRGRGERGAGRTLFERFAGIRALKHRNYRLFLSGQGLSVIGTWMQRIALTWLVYRLTNSAMVLGVMGFAGQIPLLLVTPLGGVLADRVFEPLFQNGGLLAGALHSLVGTGPGAGMSAMFLFTAVLGGLTGALGLRSSAIRELET